MLRKLINPRNATIAVMVIIGIFVFLNQYRSNNKPEEKRVEVGANTLQRPYPKIKLENPVKIIWKTNEEMTLPKTGTVYTASKAEIMAIFWRLRDELGFDETMATSDDPSIKVYRDGNQRSLYINKEPGSFGFAEDITSKNQLEGQVSLSDEELKTKLVELLKKIESNEELKIKVENVDYKKIIFPRWVSSGKSDADVVEIKANFDLNNKTLTRFPGSQIKAVYTNGGRLIKLEYTPKINAGEKTEINLKSLNDLKENSETAFMITEKAGNESFDLMEDKTLREPVTVTSIELVYIQSEEQNLIWPYYRLEGNTTSQAGPVKVTMITPADK